MGAIGCGQRADPLGVVDSIAVGHSELGRERRGRAQDDTWLDAEPPGAFPVGAEFGVPADAHGPPIVRVEILPAVDIACGAAAGPAARQPVVEAPRVDVGAESGAPLVLELPVGVDVGAEIEAIAVEIERRPLVDVEADVAGESARLIPADLHPAVLRDLVGALHETQVVGVEARGLVTDDEVSPRALPGDLRDVDRARVTAQRPCERVHFHVIGIRSLEAVHGTRLQLPDGLGAAGDAASRPVAAQSPPLTQPPVDVHAAGRGARGQERHRVAQRPGRGREDDAHGGLVGELPPDP